MNSSERALFFSMIQDSFTHSSLSLTYIVTRRYQYLQLAPHCVRQRNQVETASAKIQPMYDPMLIQKTRCRLILSLRRCVLTPPFSLLHLGGLCANPFNLPLGPSMLGMGFRLLAFTVLILGTPCKDLGSFIKVGSNFAGTLVTIAL